MSDLSLEQTKKFVKSLQAEYEKKNERYWKLIAAMVDFRYSNFMEATKDIKRVSDYGLHVVSVHEQLSEAKLVIDQLIELEEGKDETPKSVFDVVGGEL